MSEAALVKAPASGPSFSVLPPLSLYVHIPWCVRKCPYCDFNSHPVSGEVPEAQYCDALVRDLERSLPAIWGRRVSSVFFGGGTPSVFSASAIDRLLGDIRARLPLTPDCEITLEANPGTFEAEKFRGYRAAGVNRLSIGIQSFNPRQLVALGRIHDDHEARRAIELALESFGNVNLDLMYGLPGQTVDEARRDAAEAVSWKTPHLSFYHLTIEPNTAFERRPPAIPDADEAASIEQAVRETLLEAGYRNYETSAYALPGFECRHNLNYWRYGDYLGIGAGAHSKISFADRIVRQARIKQPREYLKKIESGEPAQEEHPVERADIVFEFMMNALRLTEGFEVILFHERTGLPIVAADRGLAKAEERGLIERDAFRIRPTELGRRFLNDLLQIFLPA